MSDPRISDQQFYEMLDQHNANELQKDDLDPDDDEVLDVLGATFGMSRVEVLDRLDRMDLAALREVSA